MLTRLEALADAISYYNQAHEPTSPAYRNRNPGNLRAFSLRHVHDEDGHRIFNSILDGYQALLYDIKIKASGNSHSKLKKLDPTLNDLMRTYGHSGVKVGDYIAKRIRKALGDETITGDTLLSFFMVI
jgi:hypothetical protein